MTRRSIQVPAFHAATTPIGTATVDRQAERERHQRQGRLDALRDHGRDRQVGEDRLAEIAVQDLPDPLAEADQERPVEAEARPDALHVGRRRLVARDHRGGIAGGDVEQAEHEQRHHRHHRDGRDDAAGDVGQHGGW